MLTRDGRLSSSINVEKSTEGLDKAACVNAILMKARDTKLAGLEQVGAIPK